MPIEQQEKGPCMLDDSEKNVSECQHPIYTYTCYLHIITTGVTAQ